MTCKFQTDQQIGVFAPPQWESRLLVSISTVAGQCCADVLDRGVSAWEDCGQ